MLDEADQKAVAASANAALSQAKDGQTITWSNPDKGVQVAMTPTATAAAQKQVPIIRPKTVAPPVNMELIGATYEASKSSNVRSAPSEKGDVVSGLKHGERFQAIGKVENGQWILVGKGNRSVGYVHTSLVKKAEPKHVAVAAAAPTTTPVAGQTMATVDLDTIPVTDRAQELRKPVNLDELKTAEATDLDAAGFVAETVVVRTECRTMTMDVSSAKSGESESNQLKACKSGDGAWEIS